MAGRRLARRERRRRGPGALRLVQRWQLSAPRLHDARSGAAGDDRHRKDRLGSPIPADQILGIRLGGRVWRGPLDPGCDSMDHQVHRRVARRRVAAATHTIARINDYTYRWASLERTVGGRVVPETDSYVMVRTPPSPRSAVKAR